MAEPRKTVAVIKGEDAAPEAVDAALRVLDAIGAPLDYTFPLVGEPAEAETGSTFPDVGREVIDAADTTLFGATSGPSGIALFYLRFGKDTFANVRPAAYLPGAKSPLANPEGVDFVIVRENHEGLYSGAEGPLSDLALLNQHHPMGGKLHDREGMYSIKVVSDIATRRIARFALEVAASRGKGTQPGRLTIGAKHNILRADRHFVDLALDEAQAFAGRVDIEDNHIDNLARRMVAEAPDLDVVLVPNLYGDVLSDLAAGVIGGLGLMPSGCYGDSYAYFEPPHGTAPDITGQGLINPTAQILTAAMMLDHLGMPAPAARIRHALAEQYAAGDSLTRDQGGDAGTDEFIDALLERLG